jgi:hypothetical protein
MQPGDAALMSLCAPWYHGEDVAGGSRVIDELGSQDRHLQAFVPTWGAHAQAQAPQITKCKQPFSHMHVREALQV